MRYEAIKSDPEYARLVCEVLSESTRHPVRKSYQFLRTLDPRQLSDLYNTFNTNRKEFKEEFDKYYIKGDK